MNNWMPKVKHTLFAIALASASFAASAITISSGVNNPYNFTWAFNSGAGSLSGSGSLTLSGFNSSALTVNVSLSNSSALASNRLTSFGFGIDPNATGVTFVDANDGGLIDASMSSIPSLASVEVCAFGGPNCSGGANGGINGGAADSFALVLKGIWGSSVNIEPIGFKYQTGIGSFEFTTTSSSGNVPEPGTGTMALLGLALLGAGFGMRRKQAGQA